MEKFGYEKRDILVERVEDARDSQSDAQAIGSLENELQGIRQDVDRLIRNMEQSVAESETFIQRFRKGG